MAMLDTLRRLYPVVYYPCALLLALLIIDASLDADRFMYGAVQRQDVSATAERRVKRALETLTFSLYGGARELRQEQASLEFAAALQARYAHYAALTLLALSVLLLAALPRRRNAWLAHLTAIALLSFAIGVAASTLRVITYADVPVLGTVAVGYTAKTLLSTIGSLWQQGHQAVAALVFLFSFVTPLVKLTVSAAALRFPTSPWRDSALHAVHAVGKWSMVDVFVVAVLLVVFAFKGDAVSEAQPGIGIYFFAAYCVIAQLVLSGLGRRPG